MMLKWPLLLPLLVVASEFTEKVDEAFFQDDPCEAGNDTCSASFRQLRANAHSPSCATFGCHGEYVRYRQCQCTAQCSNFRNCCSDYSSLCGPRLASSPLPSTTEAYLQHIDAFLEKQPRQSFMPHGAGLLQTFGKSLGGGTCGALCQLPELCPEFRASQRCRYDVYDNAVAAIYLTKRGRISSARKILDAFLHLLYPAEKVPHVSFGPEDGLLSGRWLTLIAASYTADEVQAGQYWSKNIVDGGVDTGNNAWVALALAHFAAETGESCYLVAAHDVLIALKKGTLCNDKLLGFMAKLRPYTAHYRSTEHNIDVFALARILGDEDAANRARVFVQEMFGHNERYPQSFSMGTDGKVPCDSSPRPTAIPADAQFWNVLAGVEPTKERKVAALTAALQSVEKDGMLSLDKDLIGNSTEELELVYGMRFSNWGNGAQWETTASAVMALSIFQQKYGEGIPGLNLAAALRQLRRSLLYLLDTYGTVPASVLGGNFQAWQQNEHKAAFPGGSDTGIGWTYYRYPHLAASAWTGLALLQKPRQGALVNEHANPYGMPSKPLPEVGHDLQCLR